MTSEAFLHDCSSISHKNWQFFAELSNNNLPFHEKVGKGSWWMNALKCEAPPSIGLSSLTNILKCEFSLLFPYGGTQTANIFMPLLLLFHQFWWVHYDNTRGHQITDFMGRCWGQMTWHKEVSGQMPNLSYSTLPYLVLWYIILENKD